MKNYIINVGIREEDIDGNKIDVKKVIKRIKKVLKNEWNVEEWQIDQLKEV